MHKINVKELKEIISKHDPKVIIVDVRTKEEYEDEHIEGVRNIPLETIPQFADEFKECDEVYMQCASGQRSQLACSYLFDLGLDNLSNVEGGIEEWKNQSYPVVR